MNEALFVDKKESVLYNSKVVLNADMAELADAPDLGSGGRPCRFKSCYPHFKKDGIYRLFLFQNLFVIRIDL